MLNAKIFLATLLLAGAIVPAHAHSCAPKASQMARTELLFGAGVVSEDQWKAFLADEVTPRFPNGLTALDGFGQWKAPDGKISAERSHVLLLWHAKGAKADRAIDAIRDAYKRKFHQQSVMRVDGMDCVSF